MSNVSLIFNASDKVFLCLQIRQVDSLLAFKLPYCVLSVCLFRSYFSLLDEKRHEYANYMSEDVSLHVYM